MSQSARRNKSSEALVSRDEIYAEGTFKNVYLGRYSEGERSGQSCVGKEFKTGSVYETSFFDSELKVIEKAIELVESFNHTQILNGWLGCGSGWLSQRARDLGQARWYYASGRALYPKL